MRSEFRTHPPPTLSRDSPAQSDEGSQFYAYSPSAPKREIKLPTQVESRACTSHPFWFSPLQGVGKQNAPARKFRLPSFWGKWRTSSRVSVCVVSRCLPVPPQHNLRSTSTPFLSSAHNGKLYSRRWGDLMGRKKGILVSRISSIRMGERMHICKTRECAH